MAVILRAVKEMDSMRLAMLVIGLMVFLHPVMITVIDLASSDFIIQIMDGMAELEIDRIIEKAETALDLEE
jgi:hypothetical protein